MHPTSFLAAALPIFISSATAYTCTFTSTTSLQCVASCEYAAFAVTSCTPFCGVNELQTNLNCLCQDNTFNTALAQCLYQKCGGLTTLEEAAATYSAGCAQAGVTISTQTFIAEGESGGSGSGTGSGSGSGSSTVAAGSSTTAAVVAPLSTNAPAATVTVVVVGGDAPKLAQGAAKALVVAGIVNGALLLM